MAPMLEAYDLAQSLYSSFPQQGLSLSTFAFIVARLLKLQTDLRPDLVFLEREFEIIVEAFKTSLASA